MIIYFTHNVFSIQKYGGISRYVSSLIYNLQKYTDYKINFGNFISRNHYIKENDFKFYYLNYPSKFYKGVFAINEFIENNLLTKNNDIIHHSYYKRKFNYKKKNIITLHDFIDENVRPDNKIIKKDIDVKYHSIKNSDLIVCISENTKNDLLKFTNVSNKNIKVIHYGIDDIFYEYPMPIKNDINKKFLLFVGTRNGYKNFKLVLDFFKNSNFLCKNYDLYLFGGGNLNQNEKKYISDNQINVNIKYFEGNDTTLLWLYKSASLLLYPSIYEGFGLPVVEAMASGCPVFAGNFSSIPEVSGGNCHLCNTKDFDESFDLVSKILKDDIKLNFYKDTAKKFAQKYKWKNIIKQYELLYESIL